jgi:hypothetical protein
MPGLAEVHAWLAAAAAVAAVGTSLLGAMLGLHTARGHAARLWLDRFVLAVPALVAINVALGGLVAILAAGGPTGPADPLHFVYALVALLVVPVARLEAMRRHSTRVGWWVCAGGLVTLGALLRLWATGG